MKRASHFKIIGLRPVGVATDDLELSGKVQSIHKALWPGGEWLYVYKGYEVAEDMTSITLASYEQKRDFSIFDTERLKISVGAVVGKNGTGKSSFVELLIRAINNLTAALLGERFNFARAEHLHYIDNLYVDLLVQIENKFIIISIRGRDLRILPFRISADDRLKFCLDRNRVEVVLDAGVKSNSSFNVLKGHPKGRTILRGLFYSLVFNYSLYGFNYRDFSSEETPAERLKRLKIDARNGVDDEQTSWLGGIFHKNDGYQTPIVLHPMRHDGQLNAVKENSLAKERMLAMLFYKDADGNYPCRIINDKLKIIGIRTSLSSNKYSKENMLDTLEIKRTQNVGQNFDEIYNVILYFWSENFDISNGAGRAYYKEACDYLVYKTLKIVHTYKKYSSIFRYLSKSDSDKRELLRRLSPILSDYTHITKKLRQTVNYLVDPCFNPDSDVVGLDAFGSIGRKRNKDRVSEFLSDDPIFHLPPPIFMTDLIMVDMKHEVEGDEEPFRQIPFSGLSSGERQVAYTISNILYHLTNIDSEWDDKCSRSGKLAVIKYKYVNIILDEIELYFHPEMQRKFLFLLMQSIRCVNFRHIKGMNLLFVTHSPFVLSDIPSDNVLALGRSEENTEPIRTFGANIMEMLCDTFFMDSSLGESVRQQIGRLVYYHVEIARNNNSSREIEKNFRRDSSKLDYICRNLSDELWRRSCLRMYMEIKDKIKSRARGVK